jgi:hypothetical protein
MKKIIEFLKNWFQKNGLIKILVSFALIIISALIVRNTHSPILTDIFNIVGLTFAAYLILTILTFIIAGIVNTIRDLTKKEK